MKVGSCGKNERSTYIYVYNSKIERRTLNENEKKTNESQTEINIMTVLIIFISHSLCVMNYIANKVKQYHVHLPTL